MPARCTPDGRGASKVSKDAKLISQKSKLANDTQAKLGSRLRGNDGILMPRARGNAMSLA